MRHTFVLLLVGSLVMAGSAPARAEEGLVVTAQSVYTVGDEAVEVEVTFNLRNVVPDREEGGMTYRYFFEQFPVGIPGEVERLEARTGGGGRLAVTTESSEGGQLATIHLPEPLFYGEERTVRLTFDLVGGEPRSEKFQRVNDAYAWFVAWAYGDPGRSGVKVIIPAGSEIEWLGGPVVETVGEDGIVLTAQGVENPFDWYVAVSVRDDAALESEVVRFDGGRLTVRSWPDDDVWTGFVSEVVTQGVPALIENLGLPWPEDDLEVLQSYSPYIYGYAGWYLPASDRIEVGEDLDAQTVLHEIAHLWVNSNLFDSRWIDEGLAEELALQARLDTGLAGPRPPRTVDDNGRVVLNRWEVPRFDRKDNQETEAYGYTASWLVTHELVSEIGTEAMSQVIISAAEDLIAYRGEGEPEKVAPLDDWRRYLDLLEEVGGSIRAEDLFREYAVTRLQGESMDLRAASRASYVRLEEVGGSWGPPPAVRVPMGEWRFAEADGAIAQAMALLTMRDRLGEMASDLGVRPPDLERMFEQAEDLAPVAAAFEEQSVVLERLTDAADELNRSKGVLERVGLVGTDHRDGLEQAKLAFEADEMAQSLRAAEEVVSGIARARDDGATRVSIGLGSATVIGLGAWSIVRRRRPQPISETQTFSSPNV